MAGSIDDLKSKRLWTAMIAEFLGTLLLVLVACGACLFEVTITKLALSFGLSVATIVWTIANVSGGHINPGVTIGFLVTRKISVLRAIVYIIAQTLGAIVGAALLKALTPSSYTGNFGTPSLGNGTSAGQGFGIELFITFVLVFTVFASVDSGRNDVGGSVPLTIGLSIAMCHLWAVPLTGSGMNPARSFGPALISSSWDDHWIYWAGPLVGGAAAGFLYDLVFAVNSTATKTRGYFTRNYDDANYNKQGECPNPQQVIAMEQKY
jgi:aquaporin-4